ncbi:unnamed protein product, partial [Rotaria magnacalcarata]
MEERIGDEEIPSERAGYIPDPLADPMESASSDTIPINNSGVLDGNGLTVSSDEITNYVLPGLYPTLFCYGHGLPEDQSRPVEINLREHIRYLLSYNDRRFERNHSFIFVVFNLLQRRDACFHAQLIATKPYFRATAHEIQSLNSKDIEMAVDHISKRTYSSEPNSVLNKLLNHIKTIGGRVMGSAYSRAALRTRIHALIFNQDLPSIFLTLNPADIHSPVALYFAGVNVDLDNIRIEQLMTTYKRAETIASHPVATAKFFHLLITNILDTMIVGDVLGPVKAYFGTVENQGREDIIKEDLDQFKDEYVFENFDVANTWSTPPRLTRDSIYAAISTTDLSGFKQNIYESGILSTPMKELSSSSIFHDSPSPNKLLQTPTHDRLKSVTYASHNVSKLIPACLPTPNPSSPNFAARFRADVVQLVEANNIHKHSDTCYKYWNANRGDKKSCRMRMPRKLIPVSTIDPDTGHISMRRSDPWINSFNEYLITACRSNMDIKLIWSGSDAKALVYYITDYVTKMSLSFHDTFALVQKSITSLKTASNQTDTESAIEKSRKLVLRCYNTLASQQELSGVQVASYLMNWNDHYTTHKLEGLFLIQIERYLQTQLNEIRTKQKLEHSVHDVTDDDVYDNEETIDGDDNNDEEHFQIQSTESDKKYVLVNTRVDYQYRSEILKDICVYDFVSTLYKKKMTATDLKYLSKTAVSIEENVNQKGLPPNERYPFQNQHPQATAYLMLKYSNPHVPILYGPQIPRRDRDETRERYSRALLTLFVPCRTVADLCDCNQTWEDALKSRQHLISTHSWKIIENIHLLHECKKDRDEHLLQVIAESQVENDAIDPVLLPANQGVDGEYDIDDSDQLLELLGNLDEYTTTTANANKSQQKINIFKKLSKQSKTIENDDIKFIIASQQSSFNEFIFINLANRQFVPFVSATPDLVQLNKKWQEQLKTEGERVRRSLITGNCDRMDDTLDLNAAKDAVITMVNSNTYKKNIFENYGSILPVVSITTNFPIQKSIADEFTLNRKQRTAFMIITSHLDGDSRCRTGDNSGQLIMSIPGCGGTGKSQLIRALTKYFLVTKRTQMVRKLAPTGIAAAEIGGMTIHSFLGEQRNSGKPRTIKAGDLKLEKEWKLIEYLLIDEMSMVGLTLLAKLNRIISAAKHVDPQIPFGGVNVIFFGDYLQYRPVYDAPLHTDFPLLSKKKSTKLPTEKEIQQRVARSLILQINCVVKQTQQMRTEDIRYLQLLEGIRHGQCNYDDYELLMTRVVGQPSVGSLRDSPWSKAPILVFRNEVRTQLN